MKRQYSGYVYSGSQPIVKGSCISWSSKSSRGRGTRTSVRTDLVDTMLSIMDDWKPQPMRSMKPTNRVPNGAEQFNDQHQKTYERHDERSTNWVKTADGHNRAYPAMYDELKKRRSATKPTPNKNFTSAKTHNKTSNRTENRKNPISSSGDSIEVRKPTRRRRKCRPKQPKTRRQRDGSHSKYRCRNARIAKRRYDSRRRIYTDKTCQYILADIKSEQRISDGLRIDPSDEQVTKLMDYDDDHKKDISAENCAAENDSKTEEPEKALESFFYNIGSKKRQSREDKVSDVEDPDSNKTSVTAYESYTTMDHEPMVGN